MPKREINKEEAPVGEVTTDKEEDPDLEGFERKERRNPGRRGMMRKQEATSRKSRKWINCGICSKSQVHARRLREHMRNVQRGSRSPCERCYQVYSTAYNKKEA